MKISPLSPREGPGTILVGLAAFGLVLLPMPAAHDFGVNLVVDAGVVAITLFVLDRWQRDREAERIKPAVRAAWRTAWRIHDHLARLVQYSLEECWTMDDIPHVKAAIEEQDSRYLAPVLERLIIDPQDPVFPDKDGPGRIGMELYLSKALAEADRLVVRYVEIAPPDLIELAERLENCVVSWVFQRKSKRIHQGVWSEFLAIEHEFRQRVAADMRESGERPAWEMQGVARGIEERWQPGPGWLEPAIKLAKAPRTLGPPPGA